MFGWLKSKNDIDREYSHPSVMPPVEPALAVDISEPVIKLLEMLEQDEWEFRQIPDAFQGFTLNHAYKKDVILSILGMCLGDFSIYCDWMTQNEEKAVNKLINGIIWRIIDAERAKRRSEGRARFAALIN